MMCSTGCVIYQPLLSNAVKDVVYYLHGGIYLNSGATPVPSLPATTGKSADGDGGRQI